jgi:RNA polymerase sigma-70 factor (ECF subfamily)
MDAAPTNADELDLARRCLAGDAAALRILDEEYVRAADRALTSLRLSVPDRDDLRQKLWIKLVACERPRLALFSGRGSLAGFIRAALVRLALDERAAARRGHDDDEAVLLALPDGATDAEAALAKLVSRAAFRRCFQAALAKLTPKERTVLRQIYLDGLSSEAVAHLHGGHRATVFRWTIEARRKLAAALRAELAASLGIRAAEVPAFAALVRSEISLSLARVLA